jgi:hypothetical protein
MPTVTGEGAVLLLGLIVLMQHVGRAEVGFGFGEGHQ